MSPHRTTATLQTGSGPDAPANGVTRRARGGHDDASWDAAVLRSARIDVFDDLRACEALWRRAAQQCAHTPFQTYGWLAAWQGAVAAHHAITVVHVLGRDGETLMLLPLGIRRRFGGRCLEFLGDDLCDYNAPLIDRALASAMSDRDAVRLWGAVLVRLPPVDWVHLRRMPEHVGGTRNPLLGLNCRASGSAHAASLPSTFEVFAASRSRSFFAQNRRHRRRLEKDRTVAFSVTDDAAQRLEVLRFLVAEKARWQGRLGLEPTFADPARLAFYEQLTSRTSDTEVLAAGLTADGVLVAGLWGVVSGTSFMFLLTSYREDFASFRVGRLLTEDMIRHCIARGLTTFDLTTGDEGYKANWADVATPVFDHVAARSLRGWLLLRLRDAQRCLGRLPILTQRWRTRSSTLVPSTEE